MSLAPAHASPGPPGDPGPSAPRTRATAVRRGHRWRPPAATIGIAVVGAWAGAGCGGSNPDQQLLRIRRWEDARVLPADSLFALLRSSPPDVRAVAARALGRIGDVRAVAPLTDALEKDIRPTVRAEAAFALGLVGAAEAAPALVRTLTRETEPLVIGEAALALARLGQPGSTPVLLPLLTQPHPHVREQTLEALALLGDTTATTALLQATRDPIETVAWRAVYALEKVPDSGSLPRLYELVTANSPRVRAYVARTLGRIGDRAATPVLAGMLGSSEASWRVRVNAAVALGRLGGEPALLALAPALDDTMFHVRDAALQAIETAALALAARPAVPPAAGYAALDGSAAVGLVESVQRSCANPVVDVRASAYAALAALCGAQAFDALRAGASDAAPHVAVACVERLPVGGSARALPPLLGALADAANPRLRVAAAAALGRLGDASAVAALRALVFDDDWVLATTCIESLGLLADRASSADIARAFRQRSGQGRADVRLQAVQSLAALADASWVGLMREALADDDLRLRLAAREALVGLLPDTEAAELPAADSLRRDVRPVHRAPAQPPVVARARARQLLLSTDRGDILIDLLGEQAPQTVESFAALAARGFFDGLTFHRVVPNFVVQGGDPLGSGWGDAGYNLRCEYSPLRYEAGVVGVAHSGKDTGGCQLFVTQSDQPHLNARYTIFGRVVEGMDVVERIRIGDRFTARVLGEDPAP